MAKVDNFISNIFWLNEIPNNKKYASELSRDDVLDKIKSRFEEITQRGYDFMKNGKDSGFHDFTLLHNNEAANRSDVNDMYGFVIHGDKGHKIYLTTNDINLDANVLPYNIIHESTHIASYTDDISYFSGLRIKDKSNISDLKFNDTNYLFATKNSKIKTTNYIFNQDPAYIPSSKEIEEAKRYFQNNSMVRSDVLLKTAEFDTMLIQAFNEKFKRVRVNGKFEIVYQNRYQRNVDKDALTELLLTLSLSSVSKNNTGDDFYKFYDIYL